MHKTDKDRTQNEKCEKVWHNKDYTDGYEGAINRLTPMKIEVTMEQVSRIAMDFNATPEQIAMLERGENPFFEEMKKEIEEGSGYTEYDYAVCDAHGDTIIDWR